MPAALALVAARPKASGGLRRRRALWREVGRDDLERVCTRGRIPGRARCPERRRSRRPPLRRRGRSVPAVTAARSGTPTTLRRWTPCPRPWASFRSIVV